MTVDYIIVAGNNGVVIRDDPQKVREATCDLAVLLWLKKQGIDTKHLRYQCYAISGEQRNLLRMKKRAVRQKDAVVCENGKEGIWVIAMPEVLTDLAAGFANRKLDIHEAASHELLKILKTEG